MKKLRILAIGAALLAASGCATIQRGLDWLDRQEPPVAEPTLPGDEIDPSTISWDEVVRDVGSWPITATLTGARITSDGMEAQRIGGDWPVAPGNNPKRSIGNWWVIAKVDGQYHAATCDWLGEGKTRIVGKHWIAGLDGLHGALAGWTATSGEVVGIMQSTPARAGVETITERTQVVKVVVP